MASVEMVVALVSYPLHPLLEGSSLQWCSMRRQEYNSVV